MTEQIGRTTRLEAVNMMLRSIGERQVATLVDPTRGDVAAAISELDNSSRIVQEEGWNWNYEIRDLQRQSDNRIQVPSAALAVGIVGPIGRDEVVARGSYFFNITDSTYTFDDDIKVELIIQLAFEDIPEPARQYIMARGARRLAQTRVGDQLLIQTLLQDEGRARQALEHSELEQGDFNIFQSPELSRLHNPWLR